MFLEIKVTTPLKINAYVIYEWSPSEVKGNFRNSILIPESGWEDFREVFDEYTKQCKEQE